MTPAPSIPRSERLAELARAPRERRFSRTGQGARLLPTTQRQVEQVRRMAARARTATTTPTTDPGGRRP